MALSASFVADFSSFIDQTKEAVAAMQGFKGEAAGMGASVDQGLEDSVKKYVAVGAQIREVTGQIVDAAQPFIKAFTEEQDAVQRLTSALQANGNATPEIISQYQALATQFQNTTKQADEAVISAAAVLTTIGHVGPEQMELALTATTNLASALQVDLGQAANIVSKALASGGENLGRLKGIMQDTIPEGAGTAEMLQLINDKVGPAAQNELKTYNGQIAQMNNQMSDFQEQVGGVLVEMLTKVMGAFQSLPKPVQDFSIVVGVLGTALAPVIVSLSTLITMLTTTGIGAGLITFFTTFATMIGPAGWVAIAIAGFVGLIIRNWDTIVAYTQKLYEGIKAWLVDGFDRIIGWVKDKIAAVTGAFQNMYNAVVGHSIVPDMINGIGSEFSRLDSVMVQPVSEAASQVQAHLALMAHQMRANAILSRNSLFTTAGQLEEIARLPIPTFGGGGGGAGSAAPVTVNNTFNLVDTESNLARRVSEIIMRQVRAGTQLGTT